VVPRERKRALVPVGDEGFLLPVVQEVTKVMMTGIAKHGDRMTPQEFSRARWRLN
jgi:hypothetical protein